MPQKIDQNLSAGGATWSALLSMHGSVGRDKKQMRRMSQEENMVNDAPIFLCPRDDEKRETLKM